MPAMGLSHPYAATGNFDRTAPSLDLDRAASGPVSGFCPADSGAPGR